MKDQVQQDPVDQSANRPCWRCLLEPSPWIGGPGAWLSMALGVPTCCPDCGAWSFNTGRWAWWKGWWSGWWSAVPATALLVGFYGVPLPALSVPLTHVGAECQVEATAPVDPPAPHLAAVWHMADRGRAETVDGGDDPDEVVLGVEQLTPAVSSSPPIAVEVEQAEAPCAPPQQDGDVPGSSLTPLVPTAQGGRDTLCDEETPGPKAKKARKKQDRPGPGMEIMDDVFTQDQVRGLIDDWLVPMLVEKLMFQSLDGSSEG